jgi:protein gp37
VPRPGLTSISEVIARLRCDALTDVGEESGPQARPMDRNWVEDIHAACRKHDTAFFFKQWGGRNKKATGRALDGKTWDEFPIASVQAETPRFSAQD